MPVMKPSERPFVSAPEPKERLSAMDALDLGRTLLEKLKKGTLTSEEAADMMVAGANVKGVYDNAPSGWLTPLVLAVKNGQTDIIKELINPEAGDRAASLNDKDNAQESIWKYAFPAGKKDIWEFLFENGASTADALQTATRQNNADAINFVLDKGCDINTCFLNDGSTSLCTAVRYSAMDALETLLERGADVNIASQISGDTPLMFAVWSGKIEMIRPLLEHGAKTDTINRAGMSITNHIPNREAFQVIKDFEREQTIKSFQSAADKGTTKPRRIHRPKKEVKP